MRQKTKAMFWKMFDARTQVTKVMIFSLFQSTYLLLVDPYNFPLNFVCVISLVIQRPCFEKSEQRVCHPHNKDFFSFNLCRYRYLVLLEYWMFLREEAGLTRNYRVRFLTALSHCAKLGETPPPLSLNIQFLVVLPNCSGEWSFRFVSDTLPALTRDLILSSESSWGRWYILVPENDRQWNY